MSRGKRYAVLNADDEASAYFARITPQQVITYGIENPADVRGRKHSNPQRGNILHAAHFSRVDRYPLQLIGKFSVYNALAAAAVALAEGVSLEAVRAAWRRSPG